MIINIKNKEFLYQIYKLIGNIKNCPKANIIEMMGKGLNNDNEIILAYINDDKEDKIVRGFLYATVDNMDGERTAFIQAAYMSPKYNKYSQNVFDKLIEWSKQRNINRMDIITTRFPDSFRRKYGFEYTGTLMKRYISKEDNNG